MAYIPGVNTVKIAWNYVLGLDPVAITMHALTPGAVTIPQQSAIANLAQVWCTADLMTHVSSQMVFNSVVVTDLTTVNSPVITQNVSPPVAGTVAVNSLPASVALVVTLQTQLRGRNYRGRAYVPGIPTTDQFDQSNFVGTYVSQIQNQFSALLTQMTAGGYTMCVFSRFLNKLPRVVGVSTPIATVRGNARIGSQRRRIGGR